MKESALERSSLNLRLHLKLGGLCVGQTQHCTFSTDLLVHSRNRIDHFRERSSHPSRALSPPSQHRLQQDAWSVQLIFWEAKNHVRFTMYKVMDIQNEFWFLLGNWIEWDRVTVLSNGGGGRWCFPIFPAEFLGTGHGSIFKIHNVLI